jgi:heme A synthase
MTLTLIHASLANTSLYFALIAGIWGIALRLRNKDIDGNYWGILAVGELLFLGQGLLGGYLWISGARPGRMGIHILYGVVLIIGLPAYYAITKGRDDKNIALAYGLLCLFLAAISWRAATTGLG